MLTPWCPWHRWVKLHGGIGTALSWTWGAIDSAEFCMTSRSHRHCGGRQVLCHDLWLLLKDNRERREVTKVYRGSLIYWNKKSITKKLALRRLFYSLVSCAKFELCIRISQQIWRQIREFFWMSIRGWIILKKNIGGFKSGDTVPLNTLQLLYFI